MVLSFLADYSVNSVNIDLTIKNACWFLDYKKLYPISLSTPICISKFTSHITTTAKMSSGTGRLRETIAECLADLQSPNSQPDDRQKALQTLITITKISPQHRNLVAQNAIPILISLTKSSESTMALSILFNLSLNPNLKQSLANSSLIRNILHLITNSNYSPNESTKLAASLLCSLAMLDKNKAKFGVFGTIQILISAISRQQSRKTPASHHHLLTTLSELVHFQGNCTLAVRSGAIPLLIQLVKNCEDDQDLGGTALGILCSLARFEEGLSELMKKNDEIVVLMLEVLKRTSMMSKESAAEILVRVFDESEKCLSDALVKFPELLSSVVAYLSVRGSVKAREKANLLMKKMMMIMEDEINNNDLIDHY